jgi:hypothetical protein
MNEQALAAYDQAFSTSDKKELHAACGIAAALDTLGKPSADALKAAQKLYTTPSKQRALGARLQSLNGAYDEAFESASMCMTGLKPGDPKLWEATVLACEMEFRMCAHHRRALRSHDLDASPATHGSGWIRARVAKRATSLDRCYGGQGSGGGFVADSIHVCCDYRYAEAAWPAWAAKRPERRQDKTMPEKTTTAVWRLQRATEKVVTFLKKEPKCVRGAVCFHPPARSSILLATDAEYVRAKASCPKLDMLAILDKRAASDKLGILKKAFVIHAPGARGRAEVGVAPMERLSSAPTERGRRQRRRRWCGWRWRDERGGQRDG